MDYFESGFAVREPSWHGKEKLLADWPGSWEAAAKEAGLDWDIAVQEVFVGDTDADGGVRFRPTDWQAITRDDTHRLLDIAPPSYEPLTNAEFGEIVEAVLEQAGWSVKYETLVVLKEGRVVAVTLVAPEREVPGDPSPYLPYIAGWTSHDRSAACKLGLTEVRVVCANTQQMADLDMESRRTGFVIRHTRNIREHAAEVAQGLAQVMAESNRFFEVAAELAAKPISRTQVEEFVDVWIPVSTDMTARRLENVHESRARFWSVYEGEAGQVTMSGIRGNAWGLFQAAVETADWFTPYKSTDTLIHRQLLGGDTRKAGAMRALARVL